MADEDEILRFAQDDTVKQLRGMPIGLRMTLLSNLGDCLLGDREGRPYPVTAHKSFRLLPDLPLPAPA
jgi:hypothetical protein